MYRIEGKAVKLNNYKYKVSSRNYLMLVMWQTTLSCIFVLWLDMSFYEKWKTFCQSLGLSKVVGIFANNHSNKKDKNAEV